MKIRVRDLVLHKAIFDMNHLKNVLLGTAFMMSVFSVQAQETTVPSTINPPIFMEAFAGDRAWAYQMIINKKMQSVPKLGFFGVTHIQPEWGEPRINDFMVQGNLTAQLMRGIDFSGGFIWNPMDGIRPSAGAIFSYGNPNLVVVMNPRIDVSKNPNADVLALVEYKPVINPKLAVYTRLQGLYTHNLGHEYHSRSYLMFRVGLTYRDLTFGAGANVDWYGPRKMNKNNFGGFVAVNFF